MYLRNFAHSCRIWINNGKVARRAFYFSQCLLKKGLYYNPCDSKELRRIDRGFFTLKNIVFSHLFYNRILGEGVGYIGTMDFAHNKICFSSGMNKTVLLTNEYVYGFYNEEKWYRWAKSSYEKYYNQFNYPCVKILGFNDDKKLIIMKRVEGKVYMDRVHDEHIVQNLLYFNLESVIEENANKEVLCLQHGDAKYDNLIWDEESLKFSFIDLDGIQFLPPLFDVFYYLNSRGYNLQDIEMLIEKNKSMVIRIYQKAHIADECNPLDILFYRYVLKFKEWGVYLGNFRFLTHSCEIDYPITGKLLKDMRLCHSQGENAKKGTI